MRIRARARKKADGSFLSSGRDRKKITELLLGVSNPRKRPLVFTVIAVVKIPGASLRSAFHVSIERLEQAVRVSIRETPVCDADLTAKAVCSSERILFGKC